MDKTYKVEDGDLHIQSFDPTDKEIDISGHFDKIFNDIIDGPLVLVFETMTVLTASREAFLEQYGSEETFRGLSKDMQYVALSAMQYLSFQMANDGKYSGCNGCALFQLWILSVIHDRQKDQKYIEEEIKAIRRELDI